MIKKIFACFLLVMLLTGICCEAMGAKLTPPEKANYYCTNCGHFALKTPCAFCGLRSTLKRASGYMTGKTSNVLAGRSGPGTEYTSLGTYRVKGEYVRIINKSYDVNGVCWIQAEVHYGSKIRRIYTGLKRFDTRTFRTTRVSVEKPLNVAVTVVEETPAYYGPGNGYGIYDKLVVSVMEEATLIRRENGFSLIEQENNGTPRRIWVPSYVLR